MWLFLAMPLNIKIGLPSVNPLWQLRLQIIIATTIPQGSAIERQGINVTGLTERQQQCLDGVLQRKTAKQIGRDLGITHHAVEKHLKAARGKLGATDTLEAARRYARTRTTVEPYYGASELHQPANGAQRDAHPPRRQRLFLRDVATESRGLVYDLSPRQIILAIALGSFGILALVALIIAVAQGVDSLTS